MLAKFLCVNFDICPKQFAYWSIIKKAYDLRNIITHSNSEITLANKPQKVKDILKELEMKNYDIKDEHHKIKMASCKYPKYVSETIEIFFDEFKNAFMNNFTLGPKYWP